MPGRFRVPGTVSVNSDGSTSLDLQGAFHGIHLLPNGEVQRTAPHMAFPVVHGECTNRRSVTLLDCLTRTYTAGMESDPRHWRHLLDAGCMLLGRHVASMDEPIKARLLLRFDHLFQWGLTERLPVAAPHKAFFRTSELADQVAVIGDIVRLEYTSQSDSHSAADGDHQSIFELAQFIVEPEEPISLRSAFEDWLGPLQDLVTLGNARPCGANVVWLLPTTGDERLDARWWANQLAVYREPIFRARPQDASIDSHRMLFSPRDLPFADLVPAWFALHKRLQPATSVLLSQWYAPDQHAETRLMAVLSALESLHRRLHPDARFLTDPDFALLKSQVLEGVPEENVAWVRDRIWNEPSFKARLLELAADLPPTVVKQCVPHVHRWANESRDARNWLAHGFEPKQALDGAQMVVLAEMAQSVLTLHLLRQLAIPEARMLKAVTGWWPFRWSTREGRQYFSRLFPAGG